MEEGFLFWNVCIDKLLWIIEGDSLYYYLKKKYVEGYGYVVVMDII